MSKAKAPLYVAGTIFLLVALAHLYRLYSHFNITIGTTEVPYGANIVVAIVFGLLGLWMYCSACDKCCR